MSLQLAAEGLRLDDVKLLLSARANVNNPSKWLISPLMLAVINSGPSLHSQRSLHSQKTVACLIDLGANINCRDADGMTPLMYAVE